MLAIALPVLPAAAQPTASSDHATGTLLSERSAATPGDTFIGALKLDLADGWHVYWKNPGDSGLPPTAVWKNSPGVTAGEFRFPPPHAIPLEPLMNYGYEGEIVLPFEIKVAADAKVGDTLTIGALFDYLICADVCIPEMVTLSISLPVAAAPASVSPSPFAPPSAAQTSPAGATPGPAVVGPTATPPPVAAPSTSPTPVPKATPKPPVTPTPTPVPAATTAPTVRPAPAPAAAASTSLAPAPGAAYEALKAGRLADAAASFDELARSRRAEFSIQLFVACAAQSVEKAVLNDPSPELFILPTSVGGKVCHRVMRGFYKTNAAAAAAVSSVPSYYGAEGAKPRAIALKAVVQ